MVLIIMARGIVKGNATPIYASPDVSAVYVGNTLIFLRSENEKLKEFKRFQLSSKPVEFVKNGDQVLIVTDDSHAYLFNIEGEPRLAEKRKLNFDVSMCSKTVGGEKQFLTCIDGRRAFVIFPYPLGIGEMDVPIPNEVPLDDDIDATLVDEFVIVGTGQRLYICDMKGKVKSVHDVGFYVLPYFAQLDLNIKILILGGLGGIGFLAVRRKGKILEVFDIDLGYFSFLESMKSMNPILRRIHIFPVDAVGNKILYSIGNMFTLLTEMGSDDDGKRWVEIVGTKAVLGEGVILNAVYKEEENITELELRTLKTNL